MFFVEQVKCEFVNVTKWKVAICGDYMKSRFKVWQFLHFLLVPCFSKYCICSGKSMIIINYQFLIRFLSLILDRHVPMELLAISFTVSAIRVAIMSGLTGINHLLSTGSVRWLLYLVILRKTIGRRRKNQ